MVKMNRGISTLAVAGALIALLPGATFAITRDIAELQPARLTFEQSILNQLTYHTYRDPFDELQTRPYNLLFSNIGRHSNLSPWEGQQGSYRQYLNALIGNNGTANVDNDADSIQGSLIRRETAAIAWGTSGAFLSGNQGSNAANVTTTFSDADDLSGYDVRGAAAWQISEQRVLGGGFRVKQANRELTDRSFEQGVGGFSGTEQFDQFSLVIDAGMRQFQTPMSSWEVQVAAGFGSSLQDEFSVDVDDTGATTARSVIANYDINEITLGVYAGYNRLKSAGLGETEFRIGLERAERELDNSDLAFTEVGGVVTPTLTLLGSDPVTTTRLQLSAESIFQAGETEVFTGAQLGYGLVEGSTQADAAGIIVNEQIDDEQTYLGLTVGVRQPMYRDKIRFIVSGRAEVLNQETNTVFDTGSDSDDSSHSTAQYAIGLEAVLANVTFDIAWLQGEEAPVVPVDLGLPGGSRRSVTLDGLIFSAAVSW
jgi:hypothetical protein